MPKTDKELAKQIKNDIKSYIVKKGLSLTDLANIIIEKYHRPETAQSLSNKFFRGSIKYSEVIQIAEALNYDIRWVERE